MSKAKIITNNKAQKIAPVKGIGKLSDSPRLKKILEEMDKKKEGEK